MSRVTLGTQQDHQPLPAYNTLNQLAVERYTQPPKEGSKP